MTGYHTQITPKYGYTAIPGNICGFRFIEEFGILRLGQGEEYQHSSADNEIGMMFFSGEGCLEIEGKISTVGKRRDVFSGLPHAAYIPPGYSFKLSGGPLEAAICRTRADKGGDYRIIKESEIKVNHVGSGNWSREVRLAIPPGGFSQNLIMGETLNPPGNWSGTPPHKHEADNPPQESLHEELYYFKLDRPQGWGIQRTYSPSRGLDELIHLKDNTVTFMPWGYHQVVAAPGYTLYYLFFLAGKGNDLSGYADPEHSWIK